MKALKFLFSVLIVMLFAMGSAFAQDNNNGKEVDFMSWSVTSLDCVDEPVEGQINVTATFFSKALKIQQKWEGEFIGMETGDIYSSKMVQNSNWKEWNPATAFTSTTSWTITIKNETLGVVIGVTHFNSHLTIKDGETKVDFSKISSECY